MPPKAKTAGKTKKESEDAELKALQEMASAIYKDAHTKGKSGKKEQAKIVNEVKKEYFRRQEMMMHRMVAEKEMYERAHRTFVNTPLALPEDLSSWFPAGQPNKWLRFAQFVPADMPKLVALFSEALSEPYSAFTYEHFCMGWPDLSILCYGHEGEAAPAAAEGGKFIGAAVSKVSYKSLQGGNDTAGPLQGYIAMVAVVPEWRGMKIGQKLVRATVGLMKKKDVEEVVLETPTYNEHALKLYLDVGFVKHKFLTKYYLDGADAVRLMLWLKPLRA